MKTAILYSSDFGTTKKCALNLQNKLKGDCDVIDLSQKKKIDYDSYDKFVLGSNIKMGKISKYAKKALKNKKINSKLKGVFIVCGYPQTESKYFEKNFKEKYMKNVVCKECFGGSLDVECDSSFVNIAIGQLKAFNKEKGIRNPQVNYTKITKFANTLNRR